MIIKVEEKELQDVRDLRNNYQQIIVQLGQIELQLNDLNSAAKQVQHSKDELLTRYEELKISERSKLEELNKKYGIGDLNVETGVFTPATK